MAAHTPPGRSHGAGHLFEDILALAARLAAVAFLLSLAYLAYAAFGGGLKTFPQGFTPAAAQQAAHNVEVAGKALFGSAIVLSLCLLMLLWGWEWAGPLFLLAGAVLYVALPYFGVPQMSSAALNVARRFHPGADVLLAWRSTGAAFFLASALHLAGYAWERLRFALLAPRRAGGGLKVPFYSPCWQTHHCKDEINRLCEPGRRGFRKSCWRYKSGCFCDESIGDRMLATARRDAGKDAEKWFGATARAPQATFWDRFRSTRHRVAYQKIACADCPIYNYHELQKHRILAPLIILAIPTWMYYNASTLHGWYVATLGRLDRFALHLAFNPSAAKTAASPLHSALNVPAIEYMLYAVACLTLITFAARALEYWCFDAKL